LPILGENGDHVPAHYMMHVNGIISIVDSAPLFRLEELMTQNDEWAAAVEYLSAGITDFDYTGRRLKGRPVPVWCADSFTWSFTTWPIPSMLYSLTLSLSAV